jgi:septal ring factor EnvC (AmiA/AmiB activator)
MTKKRSVLLQNKTKQKMIRFSLRKTNFPSTRNNNPSLLLLAFPYCQFSSFHHSSTSSYQTAFEKQQLYKQKKYKEIIDQLRKISNQVKAQKNHLQWRNNTFHSSSSRSRKWEEKINKGEGRQGGTNDTHNLFNVRQQFSNQITRLLPHHFEQMTLKEITFLLSTTTSLSPVNGASHVATNVAAVLPFKLQNTDIYECTDTVIQLLGIIRSSIYNSGANNKT